MKKLWQDEAWEEYLYWQTQDKKTLKKIYKLLSDIDRNGNQCTATLRNAPGDIPSNRRNVLQKYPAS